MDSEFFTSRLKPNWIFSGFTLKKKCVDEICQKLNDESRKHQQAVEKFMQLKQDLEEVTTEKQRLETLRQEMTELLERASIAINEEREQKSVFRAECDRISEKFDALQMDFSVKELASLKKVTEINEKLEELTHTLEKTVTEHQIQMSQQRQDYDRASKEFSSEKALLERRNYDLARDLGTAKKLQEEIEKRCKQVESELASSNYEIEKLMFKKLGIEEQLSESEKRGEKLESELEEMKCEKLKVEDQLVKEREKHVIEIEDLSNQLDSANQNELKIIREFEKYKRGTEEANELEEVLFGQSKEYLNACDSTGSISSLNDEQQ